MKLQKIIIALIALFVFVAATSAQRQFRNKLDFNGDQKADIVQFSEDFTVAGNSANYFYIAQSPNDSYRAVRWGIANIGTTGDKPTAGDFDGDGRGDFVVIRNEGNNRVWYILNNAQTSYRRVVFGLVSSDIFDYPVAADYDGDGKDDIAVARREQGSEGFLLTYYWLRSSDGQLGYRQFGRDFSQTDGYCTASVPGDYDGDLKADFVQRCYKSATSRMYFKINSNATNQTQIIDWGLTGSLNIGYAPGYDAFVPGDYTGDGKTDLAVIRAVAAGGSGVSYVWYIRRSDDGGLMVKYFGGASSEENASYGDIAVPADYDGDNITDVAVTRAVYGGIAGTNFYFIIQSSQTGATRYVPFGKEMSELRYDRPLASYVSTANGSLNFY